MEEITKIFNEQVDIGVTTALTKALENISRNIKIPMSTLLKAAGTFASSDLHPSTPRPGNCCNGICANKKRCSRSAKSNGFCGHHQGQYTEYNRPPIMISNSQPNLSSMSQPPISTPSSQSHPNLMNMSSQSTRTQGLIDLICINKK